MMPLDVASLTAVTHAFAQDMWARGCGKILLAYQGVQSFADYAVGTHVRAGIRALQAGRISVVPGRANKAVVLLIWATARRLHHAFLSRAMNR